MARSDWCAHDHCTDCPGSRDGRHGLLGHVLDGRAVWCSCTCHRKSGDTVGD